MVPIHDSDVASERWNQAEWQHYELWEKIEVKLKRRKKLWIAGTVLVFLGLSSVPILISRWPKWTSLKAVRKLGEKIGEAKRLSGINHQAFRIEFPADRKLEYSVIQVPNCTAPTSAGAVVSTGSLLKSSAENYVLLSPQEAQGFGIPGLVTSFCYDPLTGAAGTPNETAVSGFGIISVKDLAEGRQDRLSLVIFKGPSGEVSFE